MVKKQLISQPKTKSVHFATRLLSLFSAQNCNTIFAGFANIKIKILMYTVGLIFYEIL